MYIPCTEPSDAVTWCGYGAGPVVRGVAAMLGYVHYCGVLRMPARLRCLRSPFIVFGGFLVLVLLLLLLLLTFLLFFCV